MKNLDSLDTLDEKMALDDSAISGEGQRYCYLSRTDTQRNSYSRIEVKADMVTLGGYLTQASKRNTGHNLNSINTLLVRQGRRVLIQGDKRHAELNYKPGGSTLIPPLQYNKNHRCILCDIYLCNYLVRLQNPKDVKDQVPIHILGQYNFHLCY